MTLFNFVPTEETDNGSHNEMELKMIVIIMFIVGIVIITAEEGRCTTNNDCAFWETCLPSANHNDSSVCTPNLCTSNNDCGEYEICQDHDVNPNTSSVCATWPCTAQIDCGESKNCTDHDSNPNTSSICI